MAARAYGRRVRDEGLLTVLLRAAYTLRDACDEGIRGAIHDKTLGGSAVSRTQLDREAVFFCVRVAVSRDLLLRGGRVVDPTVTRSIESLTFAFKMGSLLPSATSILSLLSGRWMSMDWSLRRV